MDGTGVKGILSIYDDTDSVVGMVQGSTELTTHRKNNGFMGNFKHSCNFTAVLIFCDFSGAGNPCTERTEDGILINYSIFTETRRMLSVSEKENNPILRCVT